MADTGKINLVLLSAAILLAAVSVVLLIWISLSLPESPHKDIVSDARRLAGELSDNNLPQAAIEEYKKILDNSVLTGSERGSINYLIGKTYFVDLGNYQEAAAYYIRARSLDENGSYYIEAGKNLIACLEKMGRRLAARRELDSQSGSRPETATSPGKIVAKIGSYEISLTEFNRAAEALPPEMQDQISSYEGKRQFLDQLIGRELLYHAALREGFDNDSRRRRELKDIEKEYLIQSYTREKILPAIVADTAEFRLYYKANLEKYDNKPLEEVGDRVRQDYMAYLSQKVVGEYIDKLTEAEPVQLFEENLK